MFGLVYPLGQGKMSQCGRAEGSWVLCVGVGCSRLCLIVIADIIVYGMIRWILLWTELRESGKIIKLVCVQAD